MKPPKHQKNYFLSLPKVPKNGLFGVVKDDPKKVWKKA
jgi:hypothetical protein